MIYAMFREFILKKIFRTLLTAQSKWLWKNKFLLRLYIFFMIANVNTSWQLYHRCPGITTVKMINAIVGCLQFTRRLFDAGSRLSHHFFQTLIDIYLPITVEVVRIDKRRIIVRTSLAENVKTVFGRQPGIGLQPKGYGTGDNGRRHGRASIGVPSIGSAVVVEMTHIARKRFSHVIRIIDEETAIRRYDILSRSHYVGFRPAIEGGTNAGKRSAHPTGALIVVFPLAEIIQETAPLSGRSHR